MRMAQNPKQKTFLTLYSDPASTSFGNCYKSAIAAGYAEQTARNLLHLKPRWLSESIGNIKAIEPTEITQVLTSVIYSPDEPTYIKLKALELMMKQHNMLKQHTEAVQTTVSLNLDLSGTPR